MRIDVDSNDGIVIQRLYAQLWQRVYPEEFLGQVLHIAHIGIDTSTFQIFHVVLDTYHGSLVIDTEVERSSRGGVEEGADAF